MNEPDLGLQLNAFKRWKSMLIQTLDAYQTWLEKHRLLTQDQQQRIREYREILRLDRLTLAFVAEFSRGKTELINAIFFSDYGRRLLPSAAGRTTMCPTELFYDLEEDAAYVRLLPVETRSRELTLEELKQDPAAWVNFPLDLTSPEQIEGCLREVIATRQVPLREAVELGLYDIEQNRHLTPPPDRVDIPRWRHARISFPHPLLKQGLAILDTPGLNALGSEPELTLSMLPAAQAVLFVLAADTGVTRTDLEIWQNHIKGFDPRRQQGLVVVLNKIDTLWDELQADTAIGDALVRQCNETSRILGIDPQQIFPVSAQKALLAKVRGDTSLLERSALGGLERYLSRKILDSRRDIIQDTVSAEISQMLENTLGMVASKRRGVGEQMAQLEQLSGKSGQVIERMLCATRDEHAVYRQDVDTFRENRRELLAQGERLYQILDLERIDRLIDATRQKMASNMTTMGLRSNMRRLFDDFRADMQQLVHESETVRNKARSIYRLFHSLHGFTAAQPKMFSVMRYRVELEQLIQEAASFRNSAQTAITGKHLLIRQFFSVMVARARQIMSSARREIDGWLKMVLEPLAFQIREHRDRMEEKLRDLQQIARSRDTLQQRITELKQREIAIARQQSLLRGLYNNLHNPRPRVEVAVQSEVEAPEADPIPV